MLETVSDDEIIDCNQEFLNQIGYMREEVIGHTSLELNLYVDPREYLDYFNEINKNDIVTNFELKIKKKDASFISVLYSAWLININNEKILISKGHEITDLKQAE